VKNNGCDLGLIGLGVMGRNFLLNMADNGFSVAGYDLDADKVKQLKTEKSAAHDIRPTADPTEFIESLNRPRAIMLLVPAGNAVDSVIEAFAPRLERDDLIIDGGNSHFTDTDRRGQALEVKGLLFLGTGISGGESGARYGPSVMPGGPPEGYERVKRILEKSAAHVDGDPCVTYLGPGSAGHYVKMVHNGIEYGFMELIAEVYDFLGRGLGLSAPALHDTFEGWNRQVLESYLVQITAQIFSRIDEKTGRPLVEQIRDAARQKGTGMWTSQDAMALQVPTPTIDAAVMMRNLSARGEVRQRTAGVLSGPEQHLSGPKDRWIERLKEALYAGLIVTFSQGMTLLQAASARYDYDLDLAAVARIWRGGCIIRSSVLEEIRAAFRRSPNLANLLLDPNLGQTLSRLQRSLREVTAAAHQIGIPFPGFSASIAYCDGYRSDRLPANLIQAQRDYFGSHRYERIDEKGTFHTQWEKE
jgi:6-phosphogluconate dehydrogenase